MSELTPTGNNYITVQGLWSRARCVWLQLGIWHMEMELEAIEQEHDRLEQESRSAILACAMLRTKLRSFSNLQPGTDRGASRNNDVLRPTSRDAR